MRYIKYTVERPDGTKVELARSYKDGQKTPPCPHHWSFVGSQELKDVRSESCDYKEKSRIWRRNDHAMYEPLIDRIEALN